MRIQDTKHTAQSQKASRENTMGSSVEAVKCQTEVVQVHKLLLKHNENRAYADMWQLGVNVALRITDLLSITYDDVQRNRDGRLVLTVREGKTGKTRTITLNKTAEEVYNRRRADRPSDVYLFQSDSKRNAVPKPIQRNAAYKAFSEVGDIIGVKLGTHSMRKTRGWVMHSAGVPIELIARVLNHSTPAITMRYLGLDAQAEQQSYDDFELAM